MALAYVFPLTLVRKYFALAARFAETYRKFPAGYAHNLTVIYNGRDPDPVEMRPFNAIPHTLRTHDNSGWDIGAFQRFADGLDSDLLVCLGSHCHFHRSGWLAEMVNAWLEYGPGLYGCSAYMVPESHIRTTIFWLPPELLRIYPEYVGSSQQSRYQFEHGRNSLTRHVQSLGFPCVMTTWKGSYPFPDWQDQAPDHHEILVRDQHIHDPKSILDSR